MSKRPTPETDACIIERRHIYKRDGSNQLLELIDAEFARKMERERDEARSMTEHQWLLRVGSRLCVAGCKSDGILDSIDEIIRERDEAREEWGKASMDAAQLLSEKTKVMAERDEAREFADRYRVAYCSLRGDSVPTPFPWEVEK